MKEVTLRMGLSLMKHPVLPVKGTAHFERKPQTSTLNFKPQTS